MAFADALRRLIDERSLVQKELAAIFNIAPSTLSSYVQGVREPDFKTLIAFAQYFDVTTDYLLGSEVSCSNDDEINGEEAELLKMYRMLGTAERRLFLEQGKAICNFTIKKDGKSLNKRRTGT